MHIIENYKAMWLLDLKIPEDCHAINFMHITRQAMTLPQNIPY